MMRWNNDVIPVVSNLDIKMLLDAFVTNKMKNISKGGVYALS